MPYNIESYVMFLMPLVLFGLLFAVPFISLGGQRAPIRRPWAIAGVLLTLITIISLTYLGKVAPWSPRFDTEPIALETLNISSPPAIHGYELFFEKGCQYCHRIEGEGGLRGPDLTYVGGRLGADDMTIRIVNGGYNMPAFGNSLTNEELASIIDFLQTRVKKNVGEPDRPPTAQSEE